MCAFVVSGFVYPYQAKRLVWGTSLKWPILCSVGRKTLTITSIAWHCRTLDLFVHVADLPSWRARWSASTSRFVVPAFKRSAAGGQTFEVSASQIWNELPEDVERRHNCQSSGVDWDITFVSDIAIFVLKRGVKLQLTNWDITSRNHSDLLVRYSDLTSLLTPSVVLVVMLVIWATSKIWELNWTERNRMELRVSSSCSQVRLVLLQLVAV